MQDVNKLFARAEQAFVAGRLEEARRDLIEVGRAAGDHPAIFHLLALTEKKRGDPAAARRAFERAVALAPNDPRIAGNFANLLGELGAHDDALAFYRRAVAADPGFRDARYNRALLLQKLGRRDEALADLDSLAAAGAADARVDSTRGGLLFQLKRIDEAAAAYDAALRADPLRLTALHGRARMAMERGEAGASALYARALEQKPGDLELVLGLAESLEAEGVARGLDLLSDAVARTPDWVAGHEALARMRSEAGDGAGFADHYRRSIAERPDDRALHLSYWQSLARAERHGEALAALREARGRLGDDPSLLAMEAVLAGEAGDPAAALALIDRLDDGDRIDLLFARGRAALRAGDADAAETAFERIVALDPGAIGGWAHLDLAWRLTGDDRHHWLTGQPGLFGTSDLGLDSAALARLADLLRGLHRTRAHPIGQSLRGGTQTRGRLFLRGEPEIRQLREAIAVAVADRFRALPPRDDAHPLLKYRDSPFGIEGSWSVRLSSQGFHVNHIHPEGIMSSACYIALPPSLGSVESRDGWLELGRPPVELGLDLEPLAAIEPQPGRLALFPSYLYHGTRPFRDGERLTIAFDVAPA